MNRVSLVNRAGRAYSALRDFYALRLDDADLVRGQFSALIQQVPLLYLVLAGNLLALAAAVGDPAMPVLTVIFPVLLAGIVLSRGLWWRRQRISTFSDEQVRRHMRTIAWLASALSAAFILWGMALFPRVDTLHKGHLLFFLAITQMCCVFCLTPVKAAANRVATIGMVPFVAVFMLNDSGESWMEATNLALAGSVMMLVLGRYHRSFNDLIASQRTLRMRRAESQKLAVENRTIAFTDALSGLPNRRALIARLEGEQGNREGTGEEIAVMFLDLDGFKQINDDYGHELGDALIRQVGDALAGLAPDGAMLARMGGDEFAVLIEGADASAQAHDLAGLILERLAMPVEVGGHSLHVGTSIGIAGGANDDPRELLRRSDAAMYRAKAERVGVLGYDPSFDAGRERRKLIEGEIRTGLDDGEFDVVYQPLINAQTGAVVAVEALARWPGRTEGALQPDEFIAVAETSGLIHPLGLFVLRRACEEVRAQAGVRLNVNISPAQFRHPRFEAEVARVLVETGFPPGRLQIEITEGYLVDHPERAARAIGAFQAMGVGVVLDDFGSGFASIGYLRSFGISGIKIDRSLSAALGEDDKAALVIAGIIQLAMGLDLGVTAEGVETPLQETLLRVAGCHELQGYLYGRPGTVSEVLGDTAGIARRS